MQRPRDPLGAPPRGTGATGQAVSTPLGRVSPPGEGRPVRVRSTDRGGGGAGGAGPGRVVRRSPPMRCGEAGTPGRGQTGRAESTPAGRAGRRRPPQAGEEETRSFFRSRRDGVQNCKSVASARARESPAADAAAGWEVSGNQRGAGRATGLRPPVLRVGAGGRERAGRRRRYRAPGLLHLAECLSWMAHSGPGPRVPPVPKGGAPSLPLKCALP